MAGGVDRREHDAAAQVGAVEVDGGGEQRRAGAQRERGRTARQRGALPEELQLDPANAEVAVAQERQRVVLLQGAASIGAGRGPEWHDVEAERPEQSSKRGRGG